MVTSYPRRSVLGLSLFIGQAFLYNSVFFASAGASAAYLTVSKIGSPAPSCGDASAVLAPVLRCNG